MSYEVLYIIVAVNAVVTFWLVVTKANKPARLNMRAAKLLWRSDPIVPGHEPPKIDASKFSGVFARAEREFFIDFKQYEDKARDLMVTRHGWTIAHLDKIWVETGMLVGMAFSRGRPAEIAAKAVAARYPEER